MIDLGGGGEGVISRVCGTRVVAVDKLLSEILEAKEREAHAGWTAADAAALPFRDGEFDAATAFFSCMYIPDPLKEKVFAEARRVLKPGGEFWIWDVPMRANGNVFAISLQVKLPDGTRINTGYGVRAKDQSVERIGCLLEQTGFTWQVVRREKHWFMIKAR
jgi:ubiquinone/menaquinone biosynthesis C-methylase UbiE